MKIKVCGMRHPENIVQIGSLAIDFMGFIFYEKSKRFAGDLNPDEIVLPTNVDRVGVFVNETEEKILGIAHKYKLDFVQLHGNESPEFCKSIADEISVIKAFQTDDDFDFRQLSAFVDICKLFVFDTKSKGYGGSGTKFNWEVLQNYTLRTPFLLSGGIKPEDVAAIKKFSHPNCIGVDLNSGFEDAPGMKNYQKLKTFLLQSQ